MNKVITCLHILNRDSNDDHNSEKILLLYSIMSAWVLISPEQTKNQQFFLEAVYRKDVIYSDFIFCHFYQQGYFLYG